MILFRSILVAVDFSNDSARALRYAVELARRFGAKIYLLHSYPIHVGGIAPYGMVVPESFERDCREAASKHLGQWADKVSAEGVESPQVWNTLRELGCDVAQGYGIAVPMIEAEMRTWLAHWQSLAVTEPSLSRPVTFDKLEG